MDPSLSQGASRGKGAIRPAASHPACASIRETLPDARSMPIPAASRNVLIIQVIHETDVTSGETLRFGKIGALGNLEKVPEGSDRLGTKFTSELAVPIRRRSL